MGRSTAIARFLVMVMVGAAIVIAGVGCQFHETHSLHGNGGSGGAGLAGADAGAAGHAGTMGKVPDLMFDASTNDSTRSNRPEPRRPISSKPMSL